MRHGQKVIESGRDLGARDPYPAMETMRAVVEADSGLRKRLSQRLSDRPPAVLDGEANVRRSAVPLSDNAALRVLEAEQRLRGTAIYADEEVGNVSTALMPCRSAGVGRASSVE